MRYAINKTKYLNDEETAAFESTLLKYIDRPSNTRDCVLLLTLLYTGSRASEALSIRDTDVSDGTVLVRGLKGSDDREVPIPTWLVLKLKALPKNNGMLFPIGYKRLFQIWEHYRPVRKKLHSLRHTFAIRQLRKHGRLDVIKKLLGHRSIQNTMIYSDYAYNQDEFRRLVL